MKEDHPIIMHRETRTIGERAADVLTKYLGSWLFILAFIIFLFGWMGVNYYAWKLRWDPFPFILLNLMLSALAAFQAPIIMMSQNRQATRDRIAAKYDYAVNRKAEREIQLLQKELAEVKALFLQLSRKK